MSSNGLLFVGTKNAEINIPTRPLPTPGSFIAPFWADVDTSTGSGTIRYGVTRNNSAIMRAGEEIRRAFSNMSFTPLYLFIATWEGVGYYTHHDDLVREKGIPCPIEASLDV